MRSTGQGVVAERRGKGEGAGRRAGGGKGEWEGEGIESIHRNAKMRIIIEIFKYVRILPYFARNFIFK